jgi:hypothetical protein
VLYALSRLADHDPWLCPITLDKRIRPGPILTGRLSILVASMVPGVLLASVSGNLGRGSFTGVVALWLARS